MQTLRKNNSTNGEEMFNDIKEAVFGKACGRVIELETRMQWLDKLREVIKKQVSTPKEEAWKLDTSCTVKGLCMEEKLHGVQLDRTVSSVFGGNVLMPYMRA